MSNTVALTKQDLIETLNKFRVDLKNDFSTKDNLKNFSTKDDLMNFATKTDIAELKTNISKLRADMMFEIGSIGESIVRILDEHDAKFVKKADFSKFSHQLTI